MFYTYTYFFRKHIYKIFIIFPYHSYFMKGTNISNNNHNNNDDNNDYYALCATPETCVGQWGFEGLGRQWEWRRRVYVMLDKWTCTSCYEQNYLISFIELNIFICLGLNFLCLHDIIDISDSTFGNLVIHNIRFVFIWRFPYKTHIDRTCN